VAARMHDCCPALFPRIIIMGPPTRPTLNSRSRPISHSHSISHSHQNTNTLADIDLLQQALEFAAECEADIKPEDRERMVKKILE
jgi:hypothetical protein